MYLLRVSLFGGVQVAHEGIVNGGAPTRAVQNLLAYLILQRRRTHSRESLLGTFWGEHDEDAARNCLNTTLWRLRRVLEPAGVPRGTFLLTTSGGEIGFNAQSAYWLDVELLERCAAAVVGVPEQEIKECDIVQLEEAAGLYRGDILDGVYEDWALRERERLRELYLNTLASLMRYHSCHGAPERGIAYAQEILRHDPLREEVQRELIRLHLAMGARSMAARQYDSCRRALAQELGVDPMPETQRLLEGMKGQVDRPRSAAGRGEVSALRLELNGAAHAVEQALTYLRDVVGRVEQALGTTMRH